MSDEELAIEFLLHAIEHESGGQLSFKHLEPGSKRERDAREALVRLLRSFEPLSVAMRWRLAALFDPTHPLEAREFIIRARRKGKQPNHTRDLRIAETIALEISAGPGRMEAAISAATHRYGVSRSTVLLAWRKHKRQPLVRAANKHKRKS
jgi:hypothetical protein